ncbi:MAG: hypothetical protein HY831_00260 [Candidatus Aenigmarchaeota archaeon]|nr:hypothetical protein [Candidatus Aenigmarchaeota archaeon]
MSYKLTVYALTLIVGSLLAYLINPLIFLVYLLLWIDAMIIANYILTIRTIGFELVTLSGLIAGIALGPIFGFFYSLLLMPLLITILSSLSAKDVIPIYPNINFVAIAIASAMIGFLPAQFGFLIAVIIALLFKQITAAIVQAVISGGFGAVFMFINFIFSLAFIYLLNVIGLLALIV